MQKKFFVRSHVVDLVYGKLIVVYESKESKIFASMNSIISEVLKKYEISEANIIRFKILKKGRKMEMGIEYTLFNLDNILKINDREKQIKVLLNRLNVPDEKIKSIKYEDNTKSWKVILKEDFDLDDLSSLTYKQNMSKTLSKVLGTDISVDCY